MDNSTCIVESCIVYYSYMENKEQFYTPEELSKILKLNIITIYRYIKAKKLKAYKFGKTYRIDVESFNAFVNKSLIK